MQHLTQNFKASAKQNAFLRLLNELSGQAVEKKVSNEFMRVLAGFVFELDAKLEGPIPEWDEVHVDNIMPTAYPVDENDFGDEYDNAFIDWWKSPTCHMRVQFSMIKPNEVWIYAVAYVDNVELYPFINDNTRDWKFYVTTEDNVNPADVGPGLPNPRTVHPEILHFLKTEFK